MLMRKYPDLGWNFNSVTNPNEQLSEEEDHLNKTGRLRQKGVSFSGLMYMKWYVGISLAEVLKLKAREI